MTFGKKRPLEGLVNQLHVQKRTSVQDKATKRCGLGFPVEVRQGASVESNYTPSANGIASFLDCAGADRTAFLFVFFVSKFQVLHFCKMCKRHSQSPSFNCKTVQIEQVISVTRQYLKPRLQPVVKTDALFIPLRLFHRGVHLQSPAICAFYRCSVTRYSFFLSAGSPTVHGLAAAQPAPVHL